MTFADIPQGASVFIDANTFVYHFAPQSNFRVACTSFLDLVRRAELVGFTSSDVLSDVAHRLMTYEAADRFGWPMTGLANIASNDTDFDRVPWITRFAPA